MVSNIAKFAVAIAALVIGCVLLSGKARINLNHSHNLPPISDLTRSEAYKLYCKSNTCDIYLDTVIGKPEKYHPLFYLLRTAEASKTINIHLSGRGGLVVTAMQLGNLMMTSKAKVITHIEGPVASAHAVIAMSGKLVVIHPASVFMFHRPAFDGLLPLEYCKKFKLKKDRGVSQEAKCIAATQALEEAFNVILRQKVFPYLTPLEMRRYTGGHDVVIPGGAMLNRIKGDK